MNEVGSVLDFHGICQYPVLQIRLILFSTMAGYEPSSFQVTFRILTFIKVIYHTPDLSAKMRHILALAYLLPCLLAKPTALRRDAIPPVQKRDALCGNNGYDKNNPVAFYVSQNPTDVTSSGCSSLCRRAQGCASFAYGAGYCLLYTAPVVDNLIPSPSSPYVFNDLACVAAVDQSSQPSASASSAVVNISPIPTSEGAQICEATTVTVSGSQLPGATETVAGPGATVTETLPAVRVTTTTTETQSALIRPTTVTLSGSISTLTLPAGTVTQTLPAVTATSTLTLPAVTRSTTLTLLAATSTLTLPAVTSTLTLPAVTSRITVSATITNTATVTIRCLGLGLVCSTVT